MPCDLCPINCEKISVCGIYDPKTERNHKIIFDILVDQTERFCFYHFKPGSRTAMILLSGCNLYCSFCPFHEVIIDHKNNGYAEFSSNRIISKLSESVFDIIGFFCNSTIHLKEIRDVARLFPDKPIIALSNGLIAPKYIDEYLSLLSAINIIFIGGSASYGICLHSRNFGNLCHFYSLNLVKIT